MSNPLSRLATRVAYGASQPPRALTNAPVPDRRRLYADSRLDPA
jgi:hypothetical protein